MEFLACPVQHRHHVSTSCANTHTPHTRHRQHNHRHQTRNAKAANRQGGGGHARHYVGVRPSFALSLSACPVQHRHQVSTSCANTHTPHTRHRQHNHRHQTRNAKATNRQGGVAAHVTTARVRAAVAPVLSLSALPPPVFIAGCVCNDYSSCARSCPGLPAVPALPAGFWKLFWNQQLDSAAGYYSV